MHQDADLARNWQFDAHGEQVSVSLLNGMGGWAPPPPHVAVDRQDKFCI